MGRVDPNRQENLESDPLLTKKKKKEEESETSEIRKDEEIESSSAACCRICLEHDSEIGDELISPCMCKGTQQFVHRSCLDHWRSVKEGFAFSHCTTCKAQFHLRLEFLEDYSWRKFHIFVARDFLLVFLFVQTVIATIGGIAFLLDRDGNYRNIFSDSCRNFFPDSWDRFLPKHPIPFYYCVGVFIFLTLTGFVGLILDDFRFTSPDPILDSSTSLSRSLSFKAVFAFVVVLVIFVVFFAVVGVALVFLQATVGVHWIWQRHFHILIKRVLTKEYVVEDLHGRYTPPELDPNHEERLKMLQLLSVLSKPVPARFSD